MNNRIYKNQKNTRKGDFMGKKNLIILGIAATATVAVTIGVMSTLNKADNESSD